jgi:DNA-binding LacI/PurR family transcriptional regulator
VNGKINVSVRDTDIKQIPATAVSKASTTRWKEIADSVQNDIEQGRLSVGDLLPSETVLTETWKVSRMTAHRAMQELQRNGLVTRQRGRGTLVAGNTPKATGNIALLFHNPLDQLEIEYMRGINIGMTDDFQLLFCDSHADVDREARYLHRMQKEADGIICMPSGNPRTTPILRKILDSGFPIVCVDRVPQDMNVDAVVTDNFGASATALRELVKRGHQRIAHFTEDEMLISAVHERYQAFIQVMREAGEPHPERLVRFFPTGVQKSFEGMVQLMHDALFTLMHQPDPPTALFCLNDYCLTVLLAAVEQLEIKIPEDMEILTYHDALTLMPSVSARLHRIVQDPRRMGQLAAELLRSRMQDATRPPEVHRVSAAIHSLQADFPTPSRQYSEHNSLKGTSDIRQVREPQNAAVL